MNEILQVRDIKKSYHTIHGEIEAIKNISFSLNEEEFIAIVGSSGCGKSSLLSILAGLDKQSAGFIKINDGKKIGYMLQSDSLLPWLSVYENCLLGLKLEKKLSSENLAYIDKLLVNYGLEEFRNKKPKELSGGMRQRVALIRTLALKPDILLLDEPFSALDYQTRLAVSDDVYRIIKKEKKSVIMVTHDIAEAVSMASKVIFLSKRPAVIKDIIDIKLDKKSTPIENRNDNQFRYYFDYLWKELDVNV